MVYLCADNSLADQALEDLQEMEIVGSGEDYSVVAQLDLPDQPAERIYVRHGTSDHYPIGEVDMCDTAVLVDFVKWAKLYYPAERYCLILWDHGSGWKFDGPDFGFGSDWSSNNTISFANGEMAGALKLTEEVLGKKIDLLVFDACFLGIIEVAGEISPHCRNMVASERLVPGSGLPYNAVLNSLAEEPAISAEDFGREMVDHYYDLYHDSIPVNLALWNLSGYDRFRVKLKDMVLEKIELTPDTDLPKKVERPLSGYCDLGSVIRIIEPGFGFDEIISYNRDVTNYSGCGIWFPDSYYDFRRAVDDYLKLNWESSGWARFLNFIYNQDDIPPDRPVIVKQTISDNSLSLSWMTAFDLADTRYQICDASLFKPIFSDPGTGANWTLDGFILTSEGYYSDDGSNLNNSMTLNNLLTVGEAFLISFDLRYNIQDLKDSLICEYQSGGAWQRLIHYYGDSDWSNHRLLIRSGGNIGIRFRYRTDGSINRGGAYIKNIEIYDLGELRIVTNYISDTSFLLYNQSRGDHNYLVEAVDRYGNRSDVDDPVVVAFYDYAEPYSEPNPFHNQCRIVFDAPDGDIKVYIISLDGRLLKILEGPFPDKYCFWDGRDDNGRPADSGIYLVLVKGDGFKRLGKIAKIK